MSDVSVTGANAIVDRVGEVQAHAFALKGGSAFNSLLSGIADAKAAERMGAIQMMAFLVTNYSDEERSMIPVVGSKQGETGNQPYDRYQKEVTGPDGKRKVPASWYTDAIHDTPEYERIKTVKRWLDGQVNEGEVVPDHIAAIAKTGAGNEMKQTLGDRVSDMRVGLTKGAMLYHHSEEISAVNPARIKVKMPFKRVFVLVDGEKVKVEGTNEFKTELVVTSAKIRLQDPTEEFEDKIYSVSSFLQLKIDDAAFKALPADQQTIVALDKTTARAPKGAGTTAAATGANDAKVPTTIEGGLTLFNALATWIDQESDAGEKVYNQLLTKLAGKDADASEMVVSVGKVCLALDSLWTIIRPRYTVLMEAKSKAAMAAPATGTAG